MESRIRKITVYGKRAKKPVVINTDFVAAVESARRKCADAASDNEVDLIEPAKPRKTLGEIENGNTVDVKGTKSAQTVKKAAIKSLAQRSVGDTEIKRATRKKQSRASSSSAGEASLPPTEPLPPSPSDQSFSASASSSDDESYRPAPRRRRKAFKARVVTSVSSALSRDQPSAGPSARSAASASPDIVDELVEAVRDVDLSRSPSPHPVDHLSILLDLCDQTAPHAFSTWLDSPDLWRSLRGSEAKRGPGRPSKNRPTISVRKLGEASFSEVFAVRSGVEEEIVLKVVPLTQGNEDDNDDDIFRSRPEDVVREIGITRRLQHVGRNFVTLHSTFVVRGTYPQTLLEEWDTFAEERGSDSPRPDCMGPDQLFGVIVLSHGGVDLESFDFDATFGWQQALSILRQVVAALADAETTAEFEHRDLHEGQVLIRSDPSDEKTPTSAVRVTAVDFGLSRCRLADDAIAHAEMTEDLFMGVGEQWDVYRKMREATGGAWQGFHPVTNTMWIHYLCRYLLFSTPTLKKPRASRSAPRKGKTLSPFDATDKQRRVAEAERESYQKLVKLEKQLAKDLVNPSRAKISARDVQERDIFGDSS